MIPNTEDDINMFMAITMDNPSVIYKKRYLVSRQII